MTINHLPGVPTWGIREALRREFVFAGIGFGLGFAVQLNPVAGKNLGTAGEFNWGGWLSTAFWVDPVEQLTISFFMQLFPTTACPIRQHLRQLVDQSLID